MWLASAVHVGFYVDLTGGELVGLVAEPTRLGRGGGRHGKTAPTSIVVVPERRLDGGVEARGRDRLTRCAAWRGQGAMISPQSAAQRFQGAGGGRFERLVVGPLGGPRTRNERTGRDARS